MRVLHLVKTSVGATWAWRQMRELVALGVEVHVAAPPGGPMLGAYESAGIVVHTGEFDFPAREPWRLPETLRRVRRLVADVAPDVVHSHFVGTTLTMRLALGGADSVPRVFQVPGPLHLEHVPFRHLDLLTAGPSDYWIGSCRWTCDRYRGAGVPDDRVFLSYYGTDLDRFEGEPRSRLRAELGLPADARLVGMVAYMYPPKRYLGQRRGLKGHEDLIDALALCRRAEPRVRGLFVGGAWNGAVAYEQRVRAFAWARCGESALLVGNRGDIPRIYADLDVAVHASHSENVGGAVESLLARRPTIATAVGGLPDLVIDGVTGWLVPPRQPARLAKAILEVLASPEEAERRAREGQALARRLFDIGRTAAEIATIYERILHGRRGARTVSMTRRRSRPGGLRPVVPAAVKRAMDLAGAGAGLLASGPLLILVACLVRLSMGEPVLFRQTRPGLRGEPFELLKFRTMSIHRDTSGQPLADHQRLTRLGRLLRRTSLDELPQLWNVLRGDMSLVGPRPLLMAYLDRYTPEEMRRHAVKPGITGWAQVNGRNELGWNEKFALDLWYVDHQSVWLDVKILALTVWKTLTGEGISQPGRATMDEFKGSRL